MPADQYQNWVVTIQLDDEEARPKALPAGVAYMHYSVERAPTTGHLHCQGFLRLTRKKTVLGVRKLLPGWHLDYMRGSWARNVDYTSKSDSHVSGPYEFGERPAQGKRNDLRAGCSIVKVPGPMKRVAEELPVVYVKFHRGLSNLDYTLNHSPPWRPLQVTWIWGPTGVGKTRSVYDRFGETPTDRLFRLTEPYHWWDGYDKHEAVLFDEFYGQIPMHTMLGYLDGYPLRLEIKGAFCWAFYTQVYITSNVDPQTLYMGVPSEVRAAFFRRITEIVHME